MDEEAQGRALLIGDWPPGHVEAVAGRYQVLRPAGEDMPPVDWLLIGPGADLHLLRRPPATLRRARVAALGDVPLRARDCDARVPATSRPADLVAALRLAERGFALGERAAATPAADHRLTGREIELLGVLGDGLGNDQIARALNISRRTVEFHLTRIFRKLGVASRVEAVLHAQRIGVIG